MERRPKIVKQIVSPAQRRAGDARRKARFEYDEKLKMERLQNSMLLTPDGGVDVQNMEAQKGRWVTREELVRRIRKMNPNLFYEQSIYAPEQGAMYMHDWLLGQKRMVVNFPHDVVFEFSVPITKPALQPVNATDAEWHVIQQVDQYRPGWRRVLVKLIHQGLITPSDAEREFKVSQGRSSQKWQRAVN